MADLDMSQYLDLFLQEADEQLDILEQETLKLEREPTQERLQKIFRAAHTLKGSSRAMGFLTFAEVTHEMENLLDLLRGGQLEVTTEIADALLACLDTLSAIKGRIADGKGDAFEASELLQQLRALAKGATAEEASKSGSSPSELPAELVRKLSEKAGQGPILRASIRLVPDCVMKFVRAFMAINAVNERGTLVATHPDGEALEEEKFGDMFQLFFRSDAPLQEWEAKFGAIGEVAEAKVSVWTPPANVAAPAGAAAKDEPAEVPASRPAAKPAQATGARKADTGQTVRVDVARLDELMNLVGELVIDRTRVAQIGAVLASKYDNEENVEALAETVSHIARITSDLQDQIMKARMLPIETVFNRFPRMVRDLANKVGKEIRLELQGGDTELDRSVIEAIGDPLLHILRNSVDHGIEPPEERLRAGKPQTGQIVVSARHQENHIVIDIEDDGRGIDVARVRQKAIENGLVSAEAAERLTDKDTLQFIFASGLSTAQQVSEVSGRGVGMDIVRSNIQKLGGIIDVESTPGRGTKFSLRLPLTLAIIRGLLVSVGGVVYVIPLGSVVETLLIHRKEIQTVHAREVILIRGVTTPLVRMAEALGMAGTRDRRQQDEFYVVIVGVAEQRIGLVVDRLIGEQEVVIKSLSGFVGDVPGVSGATILGDGNVALIADVNGIISCGRAA
ncbi:MAG: chemotaxis protein CheA [Fimbriimonadales bacterium]|nr:chemotaxis protein CheA [Fimbriimonadales bacterium]